MSEADCRETSLWLPPPPPPPPPPPLPPFLTELKNERVAGGAGDGAGPHPPAPPRGFVPGRHDSPVVGHCWGRGTDCWCAASSASVSIWLVTSVGGL